MKQLQHLLNKVNRVTAYHRHGNQIPKSALDELSNAQIEYEKSFPVDKPVMVNFAEEIDKMLKNIEEYFETPNYKNNVVEYKSYYDGAYYYLKQLKNILIMKSKIST